MSNAIRLSSGLCWKCGYHGSTVYDSRPHPMGRFRRRRCLQCKTTWATMEVPISTDEHGRTVHALATELADASKALLTVAALLDGMQGVMSATNQEPDWLDYG